MHTNMSIGITERGDAGLDFSWYDNADSYDGMILITKRLSDKFINKAYKVNSIVHATITGFGCTKVEPNVPSFEYSSIYFNKLVEKLGEDRVVLRIDPIIPTDKGVAVAYEVYKILHLNSNHKTRVRVSFMDNYPHVKDRFIKAGLRPMAYNFHASISDRIRYLKMFPDVEVCGEPDVGCTGCVSERDLEILGIKMPNHTYNGFQRQHCKCLAVKNEIFTERKQCPHGCLYCYWK